MPQLVNILSEFRAGNLDQAALFANMAALLSVEGENLDSVLEALQEEHASAPLPLGTFVALRKHLMAVSAPKTAAQIPPRTEILTELLGTPPPVMAKPESSPPVEAKTPEESVAEKAIGAVLSGRFRLTEFIGAGGTSRLYKAADLRKVEAGADDPHVAVKILTLPFKDTLEALSVLHRETEGLQALAHPNIVRVIDCDRDGDTVFMTMEFIRGKTLHALKRSSRFLGEGRKEIWSVVRGIAEAIDHAHSKYIVHGDLTPGNVMIAPNGAVKVIDFGIARLFGPGALKQRASGRASNSRGEITGVSPSYASPEMLEFRDPDPRDDIYALGCIAWEMLTGAHPFGRRNAKLARDAGMRLEYDNRLTRTEYAALARALNFERDHRTPTATQFIAELSRPTTKRLPSLVAAAVTLALLSAGAYF